VRLMNLPHIALLPFLTCNFACSYCVAKPLLNGKRPFGLWNEHFDDITAFLSKLDTKMIMISGGEPLLWSGWTELIEKTDHYWYFCTNASKIPQWLDYTKDRVKLFLAAFHRTGITVDKFIGNVKKLQDAGYPVFVKIVYTRSEQQFAEAEEIIKAGIPTSFVPLYNTKYLPDEVAALRPYCHSDMYYNRFQSVERSPGKCAAGTRESFELTGMIVGRCSHYSHISLNKVPKLLRKFALGYRGDIYESHFDVSARMCSRKVCECEWHSFGELINSPENERWQSLIDTGVWK